jgi:hypothetical protein
MRELHAGAVNIHQQVPIFYINILFTNLRISDMDEEVQYIHGCKFIKHNDCLYIIWLDDVQYIRLFQSTDVLNYYDEPPWFGTIQIKRKLNNDYGSKIEIINSAVFNNKEECLVDVCDKLIQSGTHDIELKDIDEKLERIMDMLIIKDILE